MDSITTLTPDINDPLSEINTPAVVVELDVMERNMSDFASFAESNGICLRPHTKTHKIPDIAFRQQKYPNCEGIICQTLSEAEIMANNGLDDIYISYMIVGDQKIRRLIRLTKEINKVTTTVDGPGNINPLQKAAKRHDASVEVILELDIGLHRTGVTSAEEAVTMANLIKKSSNLEFAGVMAYEAHITKHADTKEDYEKLCFEAMDTTQTWVELIEDECDLSVDEVKVGGTSTSKFSGKHPIVTEINPGMYPFNDVGELNRRHFELTKDDCAVTVSTTVISKPTENRAVVDAGSKSMSPDIWDLQPVPKSNVGIEYEQADEEHGWLQIPDDVDLEVGDRLEFIVPHVCTTINLHDTIIGIRDQRVKEVWDVVGRGQVK